MKLASKLLFPFLFFCSFFVASSAKVIITHGILLENSNWYLPGGYFYDAVEKEAQEIGLDVVSFPWKQDLGGITHYERIKAGIQLCKLIFDYIRAGETEIILIGHSYGGHVIKLASQLLAFTLHADKDHHDDTKSKSDESCCFHEATCVDLHGDEFFEQACLEVAQYMQEVNVEKKSNDFLIDAVYTLGTPNNIPDYTADMDVIEHLYNFYSKGDLVQDIVGDMLLPEPRHPRAVNFCVEIGGSGWFGIFGAPKHTEMHAQIIGKWLLDIPFVLAEQKIGGFENFTFEHDGKVVFRENSAPYYQILIGGAQEDGFFSKYDLTWLINKFKILGNIC